MSLVDPPPARARRALAVLGVALGILASSAAAATSAAAGPPAASPSTGGEPSPRVPPKGVVGGVPATTTTYPWMVALSSRQAYGGGRSGQFCAGTLVAPAKVVTAAHCLVDDSGARIDHPDLKVIQGRTDLRTTAGREVVVSGVTVNPGYDPAGPAGDWAVLTLAEPLTSVPVARLVGQDEQVYAAGTRSTVLGWGDTTGSGTYASALRQVEVPIVSDKTCARAYPGGSGGRYDAASMVCAGRPEGGRDSCAGDSGGPLLIGGRLAGIVSWGRGCALPMTPGVYTRVAAFSAAISEVVTRGGAGGTPAVGAPVAP
jgi:secreted trypsin-like serine protease